MKKLVSLILALALIAMPALAVPRNPSNSLQRKATHEIRFVFVENDGEMHALCTASALGPHALITAAHCDLGETSLGVDRELTDRKILGRIKDGQDHEIFLVDGPSFKDTMGKFYSPDTYEMDKVGDGVFMYGDGAGLYPPQFRKGYRMDEVVLGETDIPDGMPTGPVYLFDMNTIGGDSGSAIYSKDSGDLVSLVTYGIAGGKFAGAYAMHFTQAQVEQAEKFNGVPVHDIPLPCPKGMNCAS